MTLPGLVQDAPSKTHIIGTLSEYCFTSPSAQSWQYRDRRKPEAGIMPYSYFERLLYSAQYHRQHGTLHAFEQFVALYMENHDDKYLARPGFEPGISRLLASVDTNKPSDHYRAK